jgi:hypothetical protein
MTSKAPAAIDFLVAGLPSIQEDLQVLDGPPIVELASLGIAIGYDPDKVSVESETSSGGLGAEMEDFGINCIAWARSGNTDMKALRDQLTQLMIGIESYLRKNARLGGAVTNAYLRTVDLDQLQTQNGAWATIAFVITCKAFK